MDQIARALGAVGDPHERLLVAVIAAVGLLALLAVAFAVLVVIIRFRHARHRRRRETLADRLHDRLLDVIGGSEPPESLHALVRHGEETELLALLLRFARRLRGREIQVLARIGAPYLHEALRWRNSRSPEERAQAVQALAAFGMTEHAPVVLAALDDPSPYVAMTAAQALARAEHAQHADAVMRRLWRFVNWSGDYLGAMLARIGPAAAPPARRILADDTASDHARAVAADVLRRLNDLPAADVAHAVLAFADSRPSESPAMRGAALRLIAQVGHGEHLDAVRSHTDSSDGLVRAEAIKALAAIGGDREVATIAQALRDPSPWVAHEAAHGLLRLGRSELLERVSREDSPTAIVARQVLAEAASRRAPLTEGRP